MRVGLLVCALGWAIFAAIDTLWTKAYQPFGPVAQQTQIEMVNTGLSWTSAQRQAYSEFRQSDYHGAFYVSALGHHGAVTNAHSITHARRKAHLDCLTASRGEAPCTLVAQLLPVGPAARSGVSLSAGAAEILARAVRTNRGYAALAIGGVSHVALAVSREFRQEAVARALRNCRLAAGRDTEAETDCHLILVDTPYTVRAGVLPSIAEAAHPALLLAGSYRAADLATR